MMMKTKKTERNPTSRFMRGGNDTKELEELLGEISQLEDPRVVFSQHSSDDCAAFSGRPCDCDPDVFLLTNLDVPR